MVIESSTAGAVATQGLSQAYPSREAFLSTERILPLQVGKGKRPTESVATRLPCCPASHRPENLPVGGGAGAPYFRCLAPLG